MKNLRKLVRKTLEEKFLKQSFVYDDLDKNLIVFRAKKQEFFLSIAFIDHRFDTEAFTVEYFLSKTACHNEWSPSWHEDHDFSPRSRLFALLTDEEKNRIFPDEEWTPQQVDAWWKVKNASELVKKLNEIFEMVIECANRFDTHELRKKISESKGLADEIARVNEIYHLAASDQKLSVVLDEKLAKKLTKKPELARIAKSVIYLWEKRGLKFDNEMVYNASCDCYNMFFRKYPSSE